MSNDRYGLREDEPGGPSCFVMDGEEKRIVAYCDTLADGRMVTDALNAAAARSTEPGAES